MEDHLHQNHCDSKDSPRSSDEGYSNGSVKIEKHDELHHDETNGDGVHGLKRPRPAEEKTQAKKSRVMRIREGHSAMFGTVYADRTHAVIARPNADTVVYPPLGPNWDISDSDELYHVQGWGDPYFRINDRGHMEVRLTADHGEHSIDLFELVEDVIKRGHNLPLLVRFSDILRDRVKILNEAFVKAIEENEYGNVYRGVFPVKVCQQRHVVQEIVKFGSKYQYGLEAGSKPELLIVLAELTTKGALITCNGYKDPSYIETALLAQQLGQTPIIIIEKLHEIDLVLQASTKLHIKPIVGVRAKLSAKGIGRWGTSTGDRAKFGLSSAEIMEVVKKLKEVDMLNSLQLLHFHIGSQISQISAVKNALREASHFFVQLHQLGANMCYLDVGGGLGIDYDGSKTSFHASMNYTVEEYAADVVVAIKDICMKNKVPVPIIVSESGRAVASHHSVLIFNILDATKVSVSGRRHSMEELKPQPDDHDLISKMYDTLESIKKQNLQESLHDARQFKDEALTLFTLGLLSLDQRAKTEDLYWLCLQALSEKCQELDYIPEELSELSQLLSYIYYCNFSLFQSAPDVWAIQQLFPIMPLHRLDEKPTCLATLADLTCDSDGKIDKFISSGAADYKTLLELHDLRQGEPYYIGMFLNGAYQEVLGSLHNLYGDTNVIHVEIDRKDKKGYSVEHVITGDTTDEVLRYMQYEPKQMLDSIRLQSERALNNRLLNLDQYRLLVKHYEKALQKYTYLWEDDD